MILLIIKAYYWLKVSAQASLQLCAREQPVGIQALLVPLLSGGGSLVALLCCQSPLLRLLRVQYIGTDKDHIAAARARAVT